jgi:hypothetical protein
MALTWADLADRVALTVGSAAPDVVVPAEDFRVARAADRVGAGVVREDFRADSREGPLVVVRAEGQGAARAVEEAGLLLILPKSPNSQNSFKGKVHPTPRRWPK